MKLNQERFSRIYLAFITFFPVFLAAVVLLLAVGLAGHISLEEILRFTEANFGETVLILLGLYGIKSLSVAIPLMALYIACGSLLPTFWALAINSLGLMVSLTVPYLLGRLAGKPLVALLGQKYPSTRKIQVYNEDNPWFVSYILRAIHILPGDVVSMFLGAMNVDYLPYLLGSFGGLAPVMVFATILGDSIRDLAPGNAVLMALAILISSAIPLLIYRHRNKRPSQNGK